MPRSKKYRSNLFRNYLVIFLIIFLISSIFVGAYYISHSKKITQSFAITEGDKCDPSAQISICQGNIR